MPTEVRFRGGRWSLIAFNQGANPLWVHPAIQRHHPDEALGISMLSGKLTIIIFRNKEARIRDQRYVEACMALEDLKAKVINLDPARLYQVVLSCSSERETQMFAPGYILDEKALPQATFDLPEALHKKVSASLAELFALVFPKERSGEKIARHYSEPRVEVNPATRKVKILRSVGCYTDDEMTEIARNKLFSLIPINYFFRGIGDIQEMILLSAVSSML